MKVHLKTRNQNLVIFTNQIWQGVITITEIDKLKEIK